MEKTTSVKTYFVGTKQDAIEIANEWNVLLKTNQFIARSTDEGNVHLIMGEVTKSDLKNFAIEQEFMVGR
jgi:hypothetical protein